MGRPKGSKDKQRRRRHTAKIPAQFGENLTENEEILVPNFQRQSGEEIESDHEKITVAEPQNESMETIIMENVMENYVGEYKFEEGDEYGKLFVKLAAVQKYEIRLSAKIRAASKKAIAKLAYKYNREQNIRNLFNIMTFWKLVKDKKKQTEKELMNNIRMLENGNGKEMAMERINNVQTKNRVVEKRIEQDEMKDKVAERKRTRIVQLVEQGKISKAAQLIEHESEGVAEITEEVMQQLRVLNPIGKSNPFGNWAGNNRGVELDNKELDKIIGELDRQAAAGVDGWDADKLMFCYGTSGDGDDEKKEFRNFIRLYYKSMAEGTAGGETIMLSARLTPIKKETAGVRPITCGSLIYRVGMKYLRRILGDQGMLPNQFGVGSKGGMEPIAEWIKQCVDQSSETNRLYLIEGDGKEAFQRMKRKHIANQIKLKAPEYWKLAKWDLNKSTPLIINSKETFNVITNSEGVRQGGPESGYFYSLGMIPILEGLQQLDELNNKVAGYYDNTFIITSNIEMEAIAKNYIEQQKGETGYEWKASSVKTHDLWSVKEGKTSIETSGFCIGSIERRKEFLQKQVKKLEGVIHRLRQMPKQHQLLLLQQSTANKLRHLLRIMDTKGCEEQLNKIDTLIYDKVDEMRNLPVDEQRTTEETAIMGLPYNDAGLGIYSYQDTAPGARRASIAQSRVELIQRGLSSKELLIALAEQMEDQGIADEENAYCADGPTPTVEEENLQLVKQKVLNKAMLKIKHEELLLRLTPDEQLIHVDNRQVTKVFGLIPKGKYRRLTNAQVAATLNILLMREKSKGEVCVACAKYNSPQHYELCEACKIVAKKTQYRHDAIRDKICEGLNKRKGLKAITEPFVFQTKPNINSAERADILITTTENEDENQAIIGLSDIMTKVVVSAHTKEKRRIALTKATADGITDITKRKEKEIQAALQIGVEQKEHGYSRAKAEGINVIPLLISTGGTFHKIFYKWLKKAFPDTTQRRGVIADIAIILARGRAQIYNLNLNMLEMAETQT